METTTRIMNSYRVSSTKNLSLEQISSKYRQTKDDTLIAEAFTRIKNLIFLIKKREYPHIEICDIISFALEKLEMCLLTYVPGSSNKFITYFGRVFKNRLRQETQQLNYQKRCVIFNSYSLNGLMSEGFDVVNNKEINCNIIVLPKNLTDKERQYCCLLAADYGTNKEIAEYMNVSTMTLCNLRKSLKVKLKPLYK